MKIAFRVDGSKKLGMGHVNRCKILAKKLEKNNVDCIFITRFKSIYEYLLCNGFVVFFIGNKNESDQVNQILKKEKCLKLVIDTKRKSIENLIKNLDKKIKTILIDNTFCSNYVDLIIIPSIKNPNKQYPENSIVGTPYILHGIENFSNSNKRKNYSILVSMGGSDKYHITKRLLNSFHKNKTDFNLLVVLGKYNDDEKYIQNISQNDSRFNLVKNTSNMEQLMKQSIVGLFLFGITVFEAAICKLPSFVLSHSNENDGSAKLVEKYGWINYVGKYDEINYDAVTKQVLDLIHNKKQLSKMKQSCLQIDGLGVSRIAEYIQKL